MLTAQNWCDTVSEANWKIAHDRLSNPGFSYYIYREAPQSESGYEFLQSDGTISELAGLAWYADAKSIVKALTLSLGESIHAPSMV